MDSDMEGNFSSCSDEDEDPDSIEVPGGGLSLKALQGSSSSTPSTSSKFQPLITSNNLKYEEEEGKANGKVVKLENEQKEIEIPNVLKLEKTEKSFQYAKSIGLFKFLDDRREPITPLDFFAWHLPGGFVKSMLESFIKKEFPGDLIIKVRNLCENGDVLNLLKCIITAQNRADNRSLAGMFVASELLDYNGDHEELIPRTKLTPLEVFKYFEIIAEDFRKKREEAAVEYQLYPRDGILNGRLRDIASSTVTDTKTSNSTHTSSNIYTTDNMFKFSSENVLPSDYQVPDYLRHIVENTKFDFSYATLMAKSQMAQHAVVRQLAAAANKYKPSVQSLWGSAKELEVSEAKELTHEDEESDDEELIVAETYADYKPAKLQYGKKHPDTIVETASLSSVLPPNCYYKLSLPDSVIKNGLLSSLQLEAVVYACQQHEHFLPSNERAGFLIGDGAGVGKGRTIAGIIFENFNCGRKKSLWITASNDLVYDSERDLLDIGAKKIQVHQLKTQKYGKIVNFTEGVLFITYSGLIGEATTNAKINTRLKQVVQWCGADFDGPIIFDECHRAKNLCPNVGKSTKTGEAVRDLQAFLPKARVIYASATGASEPRHMAYMTRLGLWGLSTPFADINHFIKGVEQRGVGAMELVAMDMKLRGAYIARQLSFHGVKFMIVDVDLPKGYEEMYNDAVDFWVKLMNKFFEAFVLMKCAGKEKRSVLTFFWGAHQRFFKYLCIASKVKYTVEAARNAVKDGKCVVIGLQATGEAATLDQLERDEGELTDFVSTAKGVLLQLVEKYFPSPDNRKPAVKYDKNAPVPSTSSMFQELLQEMKAEPSSSSGTKRKPIRKAAQKQNFKKLKGSSDDSSQDEESDFKPDSNESESESENSSVCNSSDDDEQQMNSDEDSESPDDDFFFPKSNKKKKRNKTVSRKRKAPTPKLSNDKKKPKFEEKEHVSDEVKEIVRQMKKDLLAELEKLGEKLPPNTLDQLIDELGGPSEVAEMTGRKGRVIQDEDGSVSYESRSESDVSLETINLKEKERFMKGEKVIAIISEAASSGISLQSDRRVQNQRKRVHITLELPWSADRAIQQFGRTHRSNQAHPPEYMFLISKMAGEQRFASIVAKRLESLGALTHGDRRVGESRDLSKFNIDNKFGRLALSTVMRSVMHMETPIVPPPPGYQNAQSFYAELASSLVGVGLVLNNPQHPGMFILDKEAVNMTKFLNRILGMPIKTQNALFQYFTDTLTEVVKRAKRNGRFDLGILDLADGELKDLELVDKVVYERRHATGIGMLELYEILLNRGMSWEKAEERFASLTGKHEGFYLSKKTVDEKRQCLLAVEDTESTKKEAKGKKESFLIYKPHLGLLPQKQTYVNFSTRFEKVEPSVAKLHWKEQYDFSNSSCSHVYWTKESRCKPGSRCEVGVRKRTVYVLSGSVLLAWHDVESVLINSRYSTEMKLQVVRVRGENFRTVGLLIPNRCILSLKNVLQNPAAEQVKLLAKEES